MIPSNAAIKKLRRMGYRVRNIPTKELPLSRQFLGNKFYQITINGDVVQNQRDQLGQYTETEVEWFAARLPEVQQSSFLTLVK